MDAIDGQRRPCRLPFKIATFLRLIEAPQAKRSFDLIHVDRQPCQRLALQLAQWLHIFVEAVDRDLPALVFHCGEQVN